MEDVVERAEQLATVAHAGQLDKVGEPYIGHPARMAARVRADGLPLEMQAVAWLHDVVEDTSLTTDDLRAAGFSDAVVAGVDAISKREGEPLEDYYARVRADPIAVVVKGYDLADNSDPERLAKLDEAARRKQQEKYARGRRLLAQP